MDGFRWLFFVVSTIFFSLGSADQPFTRKLNTTILCPSSHPLHVCSLPVNGSFINIVHTRADGDKDSLHYIYSSFGAPTVFVAKTPLNSTLNFNLTNFLSENVTDRTGSLKFSGGKPDTVLALVFTELIEFSDVNNAGTMPPNKTFWHTYDLSSGIWENTLNASDVKNDFVEFRMKLVTNSSAPLNQSGHLVFKFQAFKDDGANSLLPHLHFNANITQVYVTLENIETTLENPRFSIAMVAVTFNTSNNMTISDVRSIDDETTPGAFHTINWMASASDDIYLQWKPLCYTERDMKISTARYTYHYGPERPNVTELDSGAHLVKAFFDDLRYVEANETRISFGETDDKFYTATNYSAWALTVGYGTPPVETISLMIILIISIGLGIPVILILVGGVYVISKRYRQRRAMGYEDLTGSYPPIGT